MRDKTRGIAALSLGALLAWAAVGCGHRRDETEHEAEEPQGARRPRQPPVSEHVAVDWLGRGQLYAARVVERRPWVVGVEYADGERDWVEPVRIRPFPDLRERSIQVYLGRTAHGARVIDQREELFHVALDNGGDTWVSVDQLYSLSPPPTPPPPPEEGPAARFPRRRPVDPSLLRVGAKVLAYYGQAGAPNLGRPYTAEITSFVAGLAHVRWLTDRSEGDIPASFVLHVFEPAHGLAAGDRVWIAGEPMAGVVQERRQDLLRVATEGAEGPGQWLDEGQILGRLGSVPAEALREGALVTAMWSHQTAYHATFVSMADGQATLAWHDGSTPSAVPLSDVVEIWSAMEGSESTPTPAGER